MKKYVNLGWFVLIFTVLIGCMTILNPPSKVPTVPKEKVQPVTNKDEVIVNGTSLAKDEDSVLDNSTNKKHIKHLKLNSDNTIVLVGEIGPEAAAIAQQINEKSSSGEAIYLVINSPGGSVLDGAQVVSAIQASQAPVYTICVELCASMAAIIHQYGTKRYMVDRSLLMFHEAAGGFQGPFNQMRSRMNTFNRYTDKMIYEIALRAGKSPELFKAQLANEVWIDAEDSMADNFADSLVAIDFQGGVSAGNETAKKLKTALSQSKLIHDTFQVEIK